MRDTCDEIYIKRYKQLRRIFINLCLESHGRYYFNILKMITLLYNLHIEHEIYDMLYNKKINHFNDRLFIQNTISKWDYFITFDERLSNM